MLSIFSYIWTKCFFYKYQIQLIWLLHPPLRLIIECGDPDCFSLVRRCYYFTHKNNKFSNHIGNKNSGWWLVWIVLFKQRIWGKREMNKCDVITSIIHVAGCLFISVMLYIFQCQQQIIVIRLMCFFCVVIFKVGNKKHPSFLEYQLFV